ncbi:hypothetical protein [Desulfosporosinus sp. Sb-LF]|uniref:hypothetical protein n=1 Tax=Desulfosporosinus sp. Sb-LF TaxID=2560027 RepID=UPI00107F4840|nr:hypothetical protein [Desulfosporosinus sp. Sb-LF]TGE32529.1 hypothetical protein E4K68_10075 [Desulfosporosinus sp. Sb-LF]
MTQRLVLTTQSKLTVQAPGFGERGARQMSRPWLTGGSARPVHCPVSGVGRLNGSLLGCLRKDVALCHTASRAWIGERRTGGRWTIWVDGTFHVHRLSASSNIYMKDKLSGR